MLAVPAFETMDLHDSAVLWTAAGTDGYGQPTVDAPAEIPCRWMYKQKEVVGPNGTPIAIDAQLVVKQAVAVGSIVWEGTLEDLPGTGTDYTPTSGIMKVIGVDRAEDVKGRVMRRTLNLVRYTDSLPALA